MKSTATAVFCIALLGFTLSALAVDREPTRAELDRIEATRRMIDEKGYTWKAGVTSVSHLAPEEFQKILGLRLPPDFEARRRDAANHGRMIRAVHAMYFPAVFDWRTQGGVTSIKNQGGCGSCWAFCAAAAMESQILIHSGMDEDLSEQAVLDCNTEGDDCGGGWMESAYDLWMDYGAVREACVPYHEVDDEPCSQESCEVAATLDDYYYVGDTANDIKQAVLNGPVAVAMSVCGGFGSYTSGCYEDSCIDINHGVTIVGWDDTMCGGAGAWIVKNSWGPDWGENGYIYMKYGTCLIGYAAQALNHTPGQTVHFFHDSHAIDDAAGDGDGFPETGELIVFPITVLNIGAETATNVGGHLECLTPGVSVIDSVVSYPDVPKGEYRESDSPHFSFTVTPSGPACGQVRFHLVVSSDQGTSDVNITVQSGEVITLFSDDFETDQGWTVGDAGDDATTGLWERADPDPTWWGSEEVQPGDDHTDSPGTLCYVTEAAGGASQGTYDVDGGKTTLLSPTIDLSDKGSALLSYYRWYSSNTGSNPNDDALEIDISDDDGSTWHDLETLEYNDRTWRHMEFYLEDYITLTDQVKIRFIAQDNGRGGSIVEAAVDDFSIMTCPTGTSDTEPPVVTVIAPNGGEVCGYGTNYDIQWTATDNVAVISITVLLSTDGGLSFPDTLAVGEPNDGSFTWPVPDIDSKTARVKIVAVDGALNEGLDASDADLTLWGTDSGIDAPEPVPVPEAIVLDVVNTNAITWASRIVFGLPSASQVTLGVYDVTGRHVAELAGGWRTEGYHVVDWNGERRSGSRVSPGIYFVRLDCREGGLTAKAVITK
ncbi:MAG: C1 family peptidase [Candidatus Eisenbacteria bacterium]